MEEVQVKRVKKNIIMIIIIIIIIIKTIIAYRLKNLSICCCEPGLDNCLLDISTELNLRFLAQ